MAMKTVIRKCMHVHKCYLNGNQNYRTMVGLANMKQKKKRDPHFYELTQPWKNEEQFIKQITDSVIYEDDNVVAVVKPNGVPMAGSVYDELPSHLRPVDLPNNTILSIMPHLKKHFDCEDMREIYSQPRLYSGPVVFAKNEKVHRKLQNYFKDVKMRKIPFQKYLLVSIGTSSNISNPVTFPIKRIEVGNYLLSQKTPTPSNTLRKKQGKVAIPVMEHTVLESVSLGSTGQITAALNEISLNLVKWDILEAYMVDNCLCPVLGDHIYSPRLSTVQGKTVRLSATKRPPATQELPDEVLNCLEFNSSVKVVHRIPLHIHCAEMTFPDPSKTKRASSMIKLTAPIPEFFSRTLRLLGLTYGEVDS